MFKLFLYLDHGSLVRTLPRLLLIRHTDPKRRLGPILAANAPTIMLVFKTNIAGVALLTGYHLCGVGIAGLLFVASARIWGMRHLYLLGGMLLVASSIWGALATSYKSFLWARILQGVAVCPFEALVNVSVGDMYPVHVSSYILVNVSQKMLSANI